MEERSLLYEFIRDGLVAAKPHRMAIVGIMAFCLIAGLAYALLATESFRSSVRILPPQSQRSGSAFLSQISALTGISSVGGEATSAVLYPEIAKSRWVLNRVLPLQHKNSTFKSLLADSDSLTVIESEQLFESVGRMINGYIDPITGIVTIDFICESKGLVAPFLNAVLATMEEFFEHQLISDARERRRSIEIRIEDVQNSLVLAEEKYKDFLVKNRSLQRSPALELKLSRLSREVEINAALFMELKSQLEIAKIEEIGNIPTLEVLDRAVEPIRRHSPRRFQIMVLALALGILFSTIFVKYRNVHAAYIR